MLAAPFHNRFFLRRQTAENINGLADSVFRCGDGAIKMSPSSRRRFRGTVVPWDQHLVWRGWGEFSVCCFGWKPQAVDGESSV
jgi:hypothetical protein